MAEINVPACPIPTQNTKLVISNPQPTGICKPQIPMPVKNKCPSIIKNISDSRPVIDMSAYHSLGVPDSTTPLIFSVTSWKVRLPAINGCSLLLGASGALIFIVI